MNNNSKLVDHGFSRLLEMGRNLTEVALGLGLSTTKAVRVPVMGWLAAFGGGAETRARTFIISFSQPIPSQYDIELWVNPINKRIFKSVPTERVWKLVLSRNDLFMEGFALPDSGYNPTNSYIGQPVANLASLLAMDTTPIPDKTVFYVEADHTIYALDKESSEPQSETVQVPTSGPGRWYQITSTTATLGNIDGGVF